MLLTSTALLTTTEPRRSMESTLHFGRLANMIDLVQLRREPEFVKAALVRRGISTLTMDEIVALDVEHRRLLQETEGLRAEVNELSRQVGEAHRNKDVVTAQE